MIHCNMYASYCLHIAYMYNMLCVNAVYITSVCSCGCEFNIHCQITYRV